MRKISCVPNSVINLFITMTYLTTQLARCYINIKRKTDYKEVNSMSSGFSNFSISHHRIFDVYLELYEKILRFSLILGGKNA